MEYISDTVHDYFLSTLDVELRLFYNSGSSFIEKLINELEKVTGMGSRSYKFV